MVTKAGSNGLVVKFQKILMVALALIVLFVSLPLDRAYAWSYKPVSGTRGNVSLPKIYVGDLYMPNGLTQFTLYGNTGPIVYRSAASTGIQIVKATYLVEKWDGFKWVIIKNSNLLQGQIGATQTYFQFAAPYIQPAIARGYLRFTWAFDWYATNGVVLGATYVQSSLATDHVCVTKVRLCQSYPGYFRTGGYLTGAW
jgi:hypothetical protein